MNILEKERIVQKNVIQIFKENFGATKTEDEILNIEPRTEFEFNSNTDYYESILDIFLLDEECKEHIEGRVKDTIKKVAKLWTITARYYFN